MSPASTEVKAPWTKEFPEVFQKLKEEGLNPSQWFVPTKEHLKFAYLTVPDEFSSTGYWSSTDYNATYACTVYFNFGYTFSRIKTTSFCVRAFRCVTY